MCVTSVIQDFAGQLPQHIWTRDTFSEYQEILRRLGELDRKLGQPDCVDPAKEAWMRDVERRLMDLEAKARPPA